MGLKAYTSKLLGAPEGTVSDIDIDGQRLVELVVENRTKRGKDAFESLDTASEVEALLATLEEGLLDLGILPGRRLAHNMIKKVDGVNALGGPRGLAIEECLQAAEVDLARPPEVDGMFIAPRASTRLFALLGIEIDGEAIVITGEALARPNTR